MEKRRKKKKNSPQRVVPAQAGLSLLQHVKYVGLSKERHYLVVVSWRERERGRQTLSDINAARV